MVHEFLGFFISLRLWLGLIVGYILGKYFSKGIENYFGGKKKNA